jgi:integrase
MQTSLSVPESIVYLRSFSITGIQPYDYWIRRINKECARHNRTPELIASYIETHRAHYRNATLRTIKCALLRSFRVTYAHIHDRNFWNQANERFSKIRIPIQRSPRLNAFLSEDEVRRVIELAPSRRHAAIVQLYAITGCRREELIKVELKQCRPTTHVDPVTKKRRTLIVIPIVGKGKKPRDVVIQAADFHRIKTTLLSKRYLLETIHGRPFSASRISQLMNEAGDAAGIHLFTHMLRHSFASNMLRRGATLPEVSSYLGHSSPTITAQYYLHGHMRPEVLFSYLAPPQKSLIKKKEGTNAKTTTKKAATSQTDATSSRQDAGILRESGSSLSEPRINRSSSRGA